MGDMERASVGSDDIEGKLKEVAHHEAGHVVIAALLGLRLRSEGLMIDTIGEGLGCYCKEPGGSDVLRERVIVATFAGCFAQNRFCKEQSRPPLEYFTITFSTDWVEARGIVTKVSNDHLGGRSIVAFQECLERQSEQLVAENWLAIDAVASALLARDWEPVKPLRSGNRWSKQAMAKYIAGDEAVSILEQCGIAATWVPDC
jgi:hypothetical protein